MIPGSGIVGCPARGVPVPLSDPTVGDYTRGGGLFVVLFAASPCPLASTTRHCNRGGRGPIFSLLKEVLLI